MAASAGSLIVSLGLEAAQFTAGLTKSEYQAKKFAETVTRDVKAASVALAGIGSIALGAGAALLQVADSVAAYQDLADQMGVTSEAVAGLQLAADLSGVSLDTVAAASVKLTASLSKTDDESKAVGKALAALNIPIAEFKRLDPVAQLERVAKEMANYGAGAGKTAVAVDLFGKSGAALIPILNDMAEVGARNSRLTQEQIDAADRLSKEFARLKSEAGQLGQSFVVQLIPPLVRATNAAMDAIKQFGLLGAIKFNMDRNPFANKLTEIADAQGKVAKAQTELDNFKPTGRFFGLDEKKAASLRETVQLRQKEFEYLKREYGLTSQAGAGRGVAQIVPLQLEYSTAPDPKVPKVPKAKSPSSASAIDEAKRYIEGLQKQLERTQELTVEEQVLKDIQMGRLGSVTTAQKDELLGIAAQIDAAKELTEQRKLEVDALAEQQRLRKSMMDEGKRLYEETRKPLEIFNAAQDRLNTLLESGAIDFVTAARAGELYKKTLDESTKTVSKMDEFAQQAAASIQDSIGQGLVDIMEGNFNDIGKSFGKMLTRIAAEAVAADIARKLFGSSVKGGEGEGWLGGLLKMLGGLVGGGKAAGGSVSPFGIHRVNEQGPELLDYQGKQYLMNGSRSASITPNHKIGGGGMVVNLSQNFASGTNRGTTDQAALSAGRAIERARRNS